MRPLSVEPVFHFDPLRSADGEGRTNAYLEWWNSGEAPKGTTVVGDDGKVRYDIVGGSVAASTAYGKLPPEERAKWQRQADEKNAARAALKENEPKLGGDSILRDQ